MKMMIEISKEDYESLKKKDKFNDMHLNHYEKIIANGTPLPTNVIIIPEGATNGKAIETVTGEEFSRGASIYNHDLMIGEGEDYMAFNVDWWNSKFRTESNENEEECTYSETGCGSCKRQLDCPVKAESEE